MIFPTFILLAISLVNAVDNKGDAIPGISQGSVRRNQTAASGSSVNVCRQCDYLGVIYQGNAPFRFERGCWQYNCYCNCDGGFECPPDRSKYTCSGSEECIRCDVTAFDGSYEEPNTNFELRRGCELYENCRCHCDGGWTCDDGVYTCDLETGCVVDDTRYAIGQSFDVVRGCDKYTDCVCNEGGEWKCEQATDICGKCRQCKIGDEYYDGGTQAFQATVNCTTYRSCDCKCDGTFSCQAGFNTCDEPDDLITDGTCPSCRINGRTYRNGQSFDYEASCMAYSSCLCRCGSVSCRDVTETCGDCRTCNVDGKEYEAGAVFSHKQDCYEYKKCQCNCDGRWECFGDNAVDTCNTCKKCSADGTPYEAYSNFHVDRQCWNYQCFCLCNGTTWCPSATVVNTCTQPDRCLRCEVGGRDIKGNTHFKYELNGMDMHCRCNCDGSYACVAEWLYVRTNGSITGTGFGTTGSGCLSCLMDGRSYRGDTKYRITRSGISMDCACSCDGSYACYGEKRSEYTGCLGCSVGGASYDGNKNFSIVYKAMKLGCQCSCDGSYECTGSTQEHLEAWRLQCLGSGLSGCLPDVSTRCVHSGMMYRFGETFQFLYGRVNMNCICGIDGSYYCESMSGSWTSSVSGSWSASGAWTGALLVLSCVDGSCVTVGCQRCLVGGRAYEYTAQFPYRFNNINMMCTCQCDGRSYCIGIETSYNATCIDSTCTQTGCTGCQYCDKTFQGGTSFNLIHRGLRMECSCQCDSSYRCVSVTGSDGFECQPGETCGPKRCRKCRADGRRYRGRSEFTSNYRDTSVRCSCGCDGSYYCTGITTEVELSCLRGRECIVIGGGCRSCVVDGKTYEEGQQYVIRTGSGSQQCRCQCDGTSECSVPVCASCTIYGAVYEGNTQTRITRGSESYICSCYCTGEHVCETEYRPECTQCQVAGRMYVGDTAFQATIENTLMDCRCDCNGRYECISEYKICKPTKCWNKCQHCMIDGQRYAGNPGYRFEVHVFGLDMQCLCNCDGSYHCTCPTRTCTSTSGCVDNCQECVIDNQRFEENDDFQANVFGNQMRCTCACNGSYRCVSQLRTCTSTSGCVDNCRNCVIDNTQYRQNANFQAEVFGYRMQCSCECNGSYRCTSEEKICTSSGCVDNCRQCVIDGQRFDRNSNFRADVFGYRMQCSCDCSGSYRCTSETHVCTSAGCVDNCRQCVIDNRRFDRNRNFQADVFGYSMQCSCDCSGSYRCTSERKTCTSSGCVDNCRQCVIDNRRFDRNPNFQADVFGYSMQCSCDCSGSYRCTSETKICTSTGCVDNCRQCVIDNRRFDRNSNFRAEVYGYSMQCSCDCTGNFRCTSETHVCTSAGCVDNCRQCVIDNRRFERNPNFQVDVFGYSMQCNCDCSGSYRCTSDTHVCTSAGCVDNCRQCVIDNRRFERNPNFQADVFGYSMQCSCDCSGSYRCTSETKICTSSGCVDNCRQCVIDNRRFDRNSNFRAEVFGYSMQCSCDCSGSYRCTSETKICTSAGCVDNCRQCVIDNRRFDRNSNFRAKVFGYNMQCNCDCSGSYRCTSERKICTSSGCVDNCRQCVIDGQRFSRNVNFQADVFGYRMQCSCECDGSYRCESETSICSSSSGCTNRCQNCLVNGVTQEGNTNFNTYLEGIQMQCTCDCNGNYECRGGTYTCTSRGCVSSCSGCLIEGKTYQGDTKFDIFHNAYGIDMRCKCECGGSYTCRGTKETPSCEDERCTRTGCHSCNINGVNYRGGSSFQTSIDGQQMECRCSCNGGYRCVATRTPTVQETSRTVVAIRPSGYGNTRSRSEARTYGERYTSKTYRRTIGQDVTSPRDTSSRRRNIESRMVSDAGTVTSDTAAIVFGRKECKLLGTRRRFTYEENCSRYSCHCYRNRKFKCDPEKTKTIC